MKSGWRSSSFCTRGECIEVRQVSSTNHGDLVEMRSSSKRSTIIWATVDEWDDFVRGARNHEFDA